MMALGIAQVARWDEERLRNTFERDANHAATVLDTRCASRCMALEALRGVFIASEDVSRDEMRRASAAWLAGSAHHRAGLVRGACRAAVPAFEARVRAEGLPQFRVFDRAGRRRRRRRATPVIAMRFIEPMAGNASGARR